MLSNLEVTTSALSQFLNWLVDKQIKRAKLKVESRMNKRLIQCDHIGRQIKGSRKPPSQSSGS